MGAPYRPNAIFTTSIARTTPAQKPRGRKRIIFFFGMVSGANAALAMGSNIITVWPSTVTPMSFALKRFERHAFWIILAASTLVRWAQILASRPRPGRELNELEQVAQSLALLGSFANPYL